MLATNQATIIALREEQQIRDLRKDIAPALSKLNAEQQYQIARQIIAHDHDEVAVPIKLDGHRSIEIITHRNVLQPMSSRLLSSYILSHSELFDNKTVIDIGTGTAVQGIAALFAGAKHLIAADLSEAAIDCAEHNLRRFFRSDRFELVHADLFDSGLITQSADVVVFAQPYFGDDPLTTYPVTSGMLNNTDLVNRFLTGADEFLKPDGYIFMMSWEFAGGTNDPRNYLESYPQFELEQSIEVADPNGVQTGSFLIHKVKKL